jgi:hypothetical protein
MTQNELENLSRLMAIHVQVVSTEILFSEIGVDGLPDDVRDEVVAYIEHTKGLNEKLRGCITAKFESLLTEEK